MIPSFPGSLKSLEDPQKEERFINILEIKRGYY